MFQFSKFVHAMMKRTKPVQFNSGFLFSANTQYDVFIRLTHEML